MKHIILLTIAAVILSFIGCKKVEEVNNNNEMPPMKSAAIDDPGYEASTTIRSFATFELLSTAVEQTIGFTLEQLEAYERSIGFHSYGKVADQRMEELLKEIEYYEEMADTAMAATRAATVIEQMLEQNGTYIHIVTDEENEKHVKTKYCNSPFRYVMNANRIFRVDTLYFKVFEGGHVSCATAYYNQLLRMSENDFSVLESNDIYSVFKHDEDNRFGDNGTCVKKGVKDGKTWLYVRVDWVYTYLKETIVPGVYEVKGFLRVETWAEHLSLGKWWSVKHTYTNNITGSIKIPVSEEIPVTKTGTDKGTTTGQKQRSKILLQIEGGYYNGDKICIYHVHGWGEKPNLRCNMNFY